ncbi:MAG: hypothetical protein FWD24_08130 [Treponema sp.]|nr:hypothetical protein [Treponema sp.]
MTGSTDWIDIKYKEVFEQETRGLIRRKEFDSSCTIDDLKAILKNLYIKEGADIDGRGSLQDTILSATIAAYEQFISQYSDDLKPGI